MRSLEARGEARGSVSHGQAGGGSAARARVNPGIQTEPAKRTGTLEEEGLWAEPKYPNRGTSEKERVQGWGQRWDLNRVKLNRVEKQELKETEENVRIKVHITKRNHHMVCQKQNKTKQQQ